VFAPIAALAGWLKRLNGSVQQLEQKFCNALQITVTAAGQVAFIGKGWSSSCPQQRMGYVHAHDERGTGNSPITQRHLQQGNDLF